MNALILLFFAWSFCSNIVASYHQSDSRQRVYQEQNQQYPQNPNSGYLHQQATNNYDQPQHVNYQPTLREDHYAQNEQGTFEKNSQHRIIEEENFAQNQTDNMYTERLADHLQQQQTYQDGQIQHLPQPIQPERNYDNYRVPLQPWQTAPPNHGYGHDNYAAAVSYVQTPWPGHNSYPPGPAIPQESYPPGPAILQESYPSRPAYHHWQSNGYQNVPLPYYGSPYDTQIMYNNQPVVQPPIQRVPPPSPPSMPAPYPSLVPAPRPLPAPEPAPRPLPAPEPAPRPLLAPEPAQAPESKQIRTQTWAQSSSGNSENKNVREMIASKQEVKDSLESASEKKRILILNRNGIKHVDVVNDSLLGNSQHLKTSDLLNEQKIIPKLQEGNENKYHEIHVRKQIPPSTPVPDTYKNQNINSEPIYNNDPTPPQHNIPQETNPTNWPVKEIPAQIYNPRFNHINKKNILDVSTNSPVDIPAVPAPNNNYYRPHLPNKQPNDKLNEYPNNNWNESPSIDKQQNSKTDIIFISNEKVLEKEKQHESVFQLEQERINNYKPYETNNFYQNPSQAPTHPKFPINKHPVPHAVPENEHGHHQNLPIIIYPNNPAPKIEQNFYPEHEIPTNFEPKNSDRIFAEYTPPENPKALVEGTEKPYHYTNPSLLPPNNNDAGTFESPPSKNSENLIIELNGQAQASVVPDSNDETSSIVQSYPGNENPISEKYSDDGFTSTYSVMDQGDKLYEDYYEDETQKPNDSYVPNVSRTTYSEGYYISPTTEGNIPDDLLNEDYPAEDFALITTGKEQETQEETQEETQQEATYSVEESNKQESNEQQETSGNEVVVANLEDLKKVDKSVFWYRPTEEFWDKLYSEADTGGYDRLFVFNVKVADPIVEKSSKSYVFENGTSMEETTEILWENREDELPREIRIMKIIRNPGPELALPKRSRFKPVADPTDAPQCKE